MSNQPEQSIVEEIWSTVQNLQERAPMRIVALIVLDAGICSALAAGSDPKELAKYIGKKIAARHSELSKMPIDLTDM